MTIRSAAERGLIALVGLLLLASTALAVGPSGSPDASAQASASAEASESTPSAASASLAPSSSPSVASTPAPSKQPKSASPETAETDEDSDGPPSAEKIADIVGRLTAAGVPATTLQVQVLSTKVGIGGAVRVLAFAQASGKTPAQILAMFDAGKGWGQIDHELGLSIGPGIGWIMGHGHGHGHGKGPKN
jgi:hypothetical protein